jgi:hypothetical protein
MTPRNVPSGPFTQATFISGDGQATFISGGRGLHPEWPRCGAAKRDGGACGQWAGWGTDHHGIGRCRLHAGCEGGDLAAQWQVLRADPEHSMRLHGAVEAIAAELVAETTRHVADLIESTGGVR